jgi:hypothetical protein
MKNGTPSIEEPAAQNPWAKTAPESKHVTIKKLATRRQISERRDIMVFTFLLLAPWIFGCNY